MRARLLFTAIFVLLCLPLFFMQANSQQLRAQAVQVNLNEIGVPEEGALIVHWPSSAEQVAVHRDALRAASQVKQEVEIPYQADGEFFTIRKGPGDSSVRVDVRFTDSHLELWTASDTEGPQFRTRLGSRLALLPPLLAILLAFLTRRTILSLTCGVLLGVAIAVTGDGGFAEFFPLLFGKILWGKILSDPFHLYILGFVILLSSTVAVITRMGGIDGMVHRLVRFAHNSRSVQAVAYFLGLGIFFDDYANTIVVGNSCGPLFDKQKISRAKLAYIVDSTAAPVAGVAILSTWVAYQISTYAPQLPTVGMDASDGYGLFLQTIPYRFYCLFALMMVGVVIWLQRDFGPMLKAERAMADSDGNAVDDTAIDDERIEAKPGVVARARNGVLPLFVMIFGTAFLIYLFGAQATNAAALDGDVDALKAQAEGGFLWFREVLGRSDSTKAIFMGSLAAMILASVMAIGQRLLTAEEVAVTASGGIKVLFKDAVLVLLLAWSIGKVCGEVGTANYLVALFQDLMSAQWLPIILFVAACFIAFATGSSWTTMAILQPNVVLLAYQLGEQTTMGGETLLILSIGAVLEGAIFGDHCSPISDTTVLSSTASRCRHIEHVRTQAPYALVTAFVAICAAYLPVALWNANPFYCLAVGAVLLVLIVRFVGKAPRAAVSA
ncbi:MAG: Na+/H+ antiporter NhaC family protein [Planctomycetes bacterium]|nr:Na+/H+ antiporter NhaC family protein [Planctomycetota bacterium]MCP4771664.1 Na+/H+ antiporter NhaC family protein [Planctomycetota bacterium]MCP4860036.1 Na+/H+ antiporter NhaC family protein [Planctomycetota bacterium]